MQQETGLLDSSVIAILGGTAVVSLYPPLAAAGFLMGGVKFLEFIIFFVRGANLTGFSEI